MNKEAPGLCYVSILVLVFTVKRVGRIQRSFYLKSRELIGWQSTTLLRETKAIEYKGKRRVKAKV